MPTQVCEPMAMAKVKTNIKRACRNLPSLLIVKLGIAVSIAAEGVADATCFLPR